MKRFIVVVALAAFPGLFLSHSVHAQGKKVTITGTVEDTYCLLTMNMSGSAHKQCAANCAKNGSPLSIKEAKTGTLYLAAGQKNMLYASPGLEKYVEERVTVSGKVYRKNGVTMILVESVSPAK
ncbi:MAG: hypothetical protein KGJ59_02370 [Bacteroidota bacterium]|nr:hypothetical protein [Bacteroidota bacterium]